MAVISLSACFAYGNGKQQTVCLTIYPREPEHDRVEFRFNDDDGQPVIYRDFSTTAEQLGLTAEEKIELSNVCVALNALQV